MISVKNICHSGSRYTTWLHSVFFFLLELSGLKLHMISKRRLIRKLITEPIFAAPFACVPFSIQYVIHTQMICSPQPPL